MVRPYPLAVVAADHFRWRETGPVDAEAALTSPDVSLYALDPLRRRAVFVVARPGADLLAAPFFYQAQYENADSLLIVGYETLHALAADRHETGARLLLLQSVGRCGSTLVSRMLAATPGVASLSEPDVFTQLVALRSQGVHDDEETGALLRSCVRIVATTSVAAPARTVAMKFRSFVVGLAPLFERHFPEARVAFLYRDAHSWCASTMRAFGAVAEAPPDEQAAAQDRLGRLVPLLARYRAAKGRLLTPTEAMACHWVGLMADAAGRGGRMFGLRYADLLAAPHEALAALYAHAGLAGPDPAIRDAVLAADSQVGTDLARHALDSLTHSVDVDPAELDRIIADLDAGVAADMVLDGTWRAGNSSAFA
jgi:hypothetical protein